MMSVVKFASFCFSISYGLCYMFPHLNAPYHPLYYPSIFNWPSIHRPLLYDQRVRSDLIENLAALRRLEMLGALDEVNSNRTSNATEFRSGLWPFSNNNRLKTVTESPLLNNNEKNNRKELHDKKQLNGLERVLYLGAGNVVPGSVNYLFKTSYAFVTSTATLCSVSTCIPIDQFVSGYSSVTCRRKRSINNFDLETDDLNIEPSTIQPMQTTVLPEPKVTFTIYPETTLQSSEAVLKPSFTVTEENEHSPRQKRFLFVLTSTITTYSFVTSTYTYKLYLYTNSYYYYFGQTTGFLTCRPSNVGVC